MPRNVLITGSSHGIGAATAVAFAREGCNVGVNYFKDREGAETTAKKVRECGAAANIYFADVSDKQACEGMIGSFINDFGKIDVLVNNAAYYFGVERRSFDTIPPEEWDMMMSINVKGPWICARTVFPIMKAQGKGKIINLTSEVFFTGSNGFAHYVASKGGVVGLTRALAAELGPDNITVNAVAPGFTDTEASRTIADVAKYDTSKTPLRRLGTAEDIVGAVIFLDSDDADFITGEIILVDGGRAMH